MRRGVRISRVSSPLGRARRSSLVGRLRNRRCYRESRWADRAEGFGLHRRPWIVRRPSVTRLARFSVFADALTPRRLAGARCFITRLPRDDGIIKRGRKDEKGRNKGEGKEDNGGKMENAGALGREVR
jgi:hypothetical protein